MIRLEGNEYSNVQKAAFSLIVSDAILLNIIFKIKRKVNDITNNFFLMCLPYLSTFTIGSEKWLKSMGLETVSLDDIEKNYHSTVREAHKLFGRKYDGVETILVNKLIESDNHFSNISVFSKYIWHYNIGVDIFDKEFCGNTILYSSFLPFSPYTQDNTEYTQYVYNVVGKLVGFLGCDSIYYNYHFDKQDISNKDYNFQKSIPIKEKNNFGLVLFSILCYINYSLIFIERVFVDEVPQKLKFAYLLYYYLCDFIDEINTNKGTSLFINKELHSREFRNCISHYGLGIVMKESDIIESDCLKGLTNVVFSKNYHETKDMIYSYLNELKDEIENIII